ncbi:MAG: hypothetical protein AAGA45_02260 [Verrucomicrobiota bacterium]
MLRRSAFVFALALLTGCQTSHEVKTESEIKPIHIITEHRVDPIHITVDINVDRKLDDFFGDLDQQSTLIDYDDPAEDARPVSQNP